MTIQETGHCEERSDVAISWHYVWQSPSFQGLLRFARNDCLFFPLPRPLSQERGMLFKKRG
jgi:hypothetical protein